MVERLLGGKGEVGVEAKRAGLIGSDALKTQSITKCNNINNINNMNNTEEKRRKVAVIDGNNCWRDNGWRYWPGREGVKADGWGRRPGEWGEATERVAVVASTGDGR